MQTVRNRAEEAAARTGRDVNEIETNQLHLAQMREAGLLVDLDIHGVSMFTVRASYAEMGIAGSDVRTERLRAGSKDLFPGYSKQLRSIDTKVRHNLNKHSFKVAAFGSWSWLPYTAYESFKEKHEELLAELETLKADLISNYEDLRETNRAYFAKVAARAWKDMRSGYATNETVVIITTTGAQFTEQASFVEYVVQRALGKMPLPEEIESKVRIDYRTSILYTGSELEQEAAEFAQARAEKAQARQLEAKATQVAFEVETETRIAKSQADAKIAGFKRAELEHARLQLAQMGSPLDEALDGLRSSLYESVQALLAGLRKNGGFRGKASGKASELLAYWQTLNGGLLQDEELESALLDLDSEMKSYNGQTTTAAREASIGDITSQLVEIATLTAESARRLQNQDSRASALEL